MTIAESIFHAVKYLYLHGNHSFTRVQVRDYLQIDSLLWNNSYSPVFQGMRLDHPGGAPIVAEYYSGVFRQVFRGTYVLTEYGESIIQNNQENIAHRHLIPNTHPNHLTHQNNDLFSEKIIDLTSNIYAYHDVFYQDENFGHPCLFFHQKALETNQTNPLSNHHLEYVYATIVAWGMNRSGNGGAKMVPFYEFNESIQSLNHEFQTAAKFKTTNMDEEKWKILESIFKEIRIMQTETKLVGNSKTIHHFLPNIIPPVDRSYTLKYLYGNTNIQNDLNSEWLKLRHITENFFIPLANNNDFQQVSGIWKNETQHFAWDTSDFKIIDNLIIGAVKSRE